MAGPRDLADLCTRSAFTRSVFAPRDAVSDTELRRDEGDELAASSLALDGQRALEEHAVVLFQTP